MKHLFRDWSFALAMIVLYVAMATVPLWFLD